MAMASSGEAVVAWSNAAGDVVAAHRPPGRPIGAARRLSGARSGSDHSVRVAINDRGDAIVAWQSGPGVLASYRPAGGAFGPPEAVSNTGTPPSVAIDPDGVATVMWSGDGPGDGAIMASTRSSAGTYRQEYLGGGQGPTIRGDPAGNEIAWWYDVPRCWGAEAPVLIRCEDGRTFVARRDGRSFGGSRSTLLDTSESRLALDGVGNAMAVWVTSPGKQHVRATTLTRFGLSEEQQELSPGGNNQLFDLAVNREGAAVAVYMAYPRDFTGASGARVSLVSRPADNSRPRLRVRRSRMLRGYVRATVSCDEICRVRGSARQARRKRRGRRRRGGLRRHRAARVRRTRARTLRARRRVRIKVKLTRRERVRLRRALRKRRVVRVVLTLRAEDVNGNRRTVRRSIRVRRRGQRKR